MLFNLSVSSVWLAVSRQIWGQLWSNQTDEKQYFSDVKVNWFIFWKCELNSVLKRKRTLNVTNVKFLFVWAEIWAHSNLNQYVKFSPLPCITSHRKKASIKKKRKNSKSFCYVFRSPFLPNNAVALITGAPWTEPAPGVSLLSLASGCVRVPCSLTERFHSDSVIDLAPGSGASGSAQVLMKCGFPLQLMS